MSKSDQHKHWKCNKGTVLCEKKSVCDIIYSIENVIYCSCRYSVLLQLHRSFYSYVLGREGGAPMTHRFAPSILATFRSACKILENLDQLYMKVPALLTRYTVFWFHAFSGIVSSTA